MPNHSPKEGLTMHNYRNVFIAVLALSAMPAWSADKGANETFNFGVGFDEGLIARYYVLSNVAAYAGFGYYVIGADTIGRQPLGRVAGKLGGEYILKEFTKFRVNAFGEWRLEMNQGETDFSASGSTFRFSQWNNIFRIGIRPELFIIDQLSIDYKIGLEYIHHGSTFKLNQAKNSTENSKNSYDESRVYCGRAPFFRDPSILLNIGITLYIMNLPKLPFFK
jgi:hypothetical protein